MSYFTIKIIALITMFIDHLGYILLNNNESMRIIGRISFPLICFLLVNGYFHTKDKVKYLVRMTVFAFLSEPCFDFSSYMCVNMYKQNVFFTLVLGLLCLMATEKYIGMIVDKIKAIPQIVSIPVGCIGILAIPVIALFKEKKIEVSKRTKMICYVFYPVHLLLLGLIRFIIM